MYTFYSITGSVSWAHRLWTHFDFDVLWYRSVYRAHAHVSHGKSKQTNLSASLYKYELLEFGEFDCEQRLLVNILNKFYSFFLFHPKHKEFRLLGCTNEAQTTAACQLFIDLCEGIKNSFNLTKQYDFRVPYCLRHFFISSISSATKDKCEIFLQLRLEFSVSYREWWWWICGMFLLG